MFCRTYVRFFFIYFSNKGCEPFDKSVQELYHHNLITDSTYCEGFIHYEVSNYYKKKPSLHNLVYWHYQDYQGIGLSAHSLIHHHRLENTRNLTKYLNHCYLDNDYHLELNDEIFEKIMMGLRLREGLDIDEINDLYHIDLLEKYKDVINKYVQLHMLEIKDRYLRVTFKGMNYLNTILVDFLD